MKIIIPLLSAVLLISCSPKVLPSSSAAVDMIVGKATMTRNGKTTALKQGQVIRVNDIIKTSNKSTVIIRFFNTKAFAEIQSNSIFSVSSYLDNMKEVSLKKGNAWIKVIEKMKKGQTFQLKTPTYVAAVRGTKFYAFTMGDLKGTCHCEGKIHYENNTGSYKGDHSKDFLTFTKGNKTIVLYPKDLEPVFGKDPDHNHSELDNSKLGKKAVAVNKENQKKLTALIEKKFKALK